MEDFRFAESQYLFGLAALPLLWWGLRYLGHNARERLLRFVAESNLRTLLRDTGGRSSGLKTLFFWLGLAFLILALARPQANPVTEEMEGSSLDIYVLLDISKSMDAEDLAPSRLKKAKREIQSLMSLLAGDRLGIIAFAGSSVIVSPLTSDYEIVRTLLQNVDTNLIKNQTTDIQSALNVAEEAMRRGAERAGDTANRSNVFIVMSDGEDQASDPDYSIVKKIQKEGGTIFTIAFGTEAGAKIPVRNDSGAILGYKRDRQTGQEVNTVVATKSLQEIASLGGGQFYFSTQDEGEVRDILNRMQSLQRSGAVMMRARVYTEYFGLFLAIGLVLVVLSYLSLRGLLGKLGLKRFAPGAALVGLSLLPAAGAEAAWLSFLWDKDKQASEKAGALAAEGKTDEAVDSLKGLLAEDPENAPLNYNLGTYYLNGKKAKEGRDQLERLRKSDSSLKYRALYNIAGSYAEAKQKNEARAAYADLIAGLSAKQDLSKEESQLLAMAKQNLARLADPKEDQKQQNQQNQDQQNQQQNQGEGQSKEQKDQGQGKDQKDSKDKDSKEQKDKESKDGKDSKDGKKPEDKKDEKKDGKDAKDGKDGQDEKKPQDPKEGDQGKSEEEKKKEEEAKAKEQEGKEDKDGEGKKPENKRYIAPKGFKERQNLSGEDAKRLLEELKLHETNLQKKFMRKKGNEGGSDNGNAKDW